MVTCEFCLNNFIDNSGLNGHKIHCKEKKKIQPVVLPEEE